MTAWDMFVGGEHDLAGALFLNENESGSTDHPCFGLSAFMDWGFVKAMAIQHCCCVRTSVTHLLGVSCC